MLYEYHFPTPGFVVSGSATLGRYPCSGTSPTESKGTAPRSWIAAPGPATT